MLNHFNEQLAAIKDKLRKRQKLTAVFKDIENELRSQKSRMKQLEVMVTKEDRDVKKLAGLSLSGLFYTILGNKELQLDKERQEYLAAKLKYDECLEAISSLQAEHAAVQKELVRLGDVEEQYRLILKEKEKLILEKNDRDTQRIMTLSEEIADKQSDIRELQEAIEAGSAVLRECDNMIGYLNSARGWGTWDMLGGGLLSTAIKHSKINEAKSSVQRTQQLLRTFYRELDDIDQSLKTALNIEINSFLTFADYFFDCLIVDWVVQSKIVNSLEQAKTLEAEMLKIVNHLQAEFVHVQEVLTDKAKERRNVIEGI